MISIHHPNWPYDQLRVWIKIYPISCKQPKWEGIESLRGNPLSLTIPDHPREWLQMCCLHQVFHTLQNQCKSSANNNMRQSY